MPRQELKDFFPTISLGQKISAQKGSNMKEYAGADVRIAKRIALFNVLEEFKMIDPESLRFLKRLAIEQNRATFASSEKTDNFTLRIRLPGGIEEACDDVVSARGGAT